MEVRIDDELDATFAGVVCFSPTKTERIKLILYGSSIAVKKIRTVMHGDWGMIDRC